MLAQPAPRPTPAGNPIGTTVVITISVVGDQVNVVLTGEIDATNADRLRTALFTHLDDGRAQVVLDISALTFIDCSGLAVIRKAAAYAEALGGSVRLTGEPHPRVHRILRLTGIAGSETTV
ncbi:STAS domain-containing protein [Actinoallomurus sp. NPDC052274]|uniref:STAS domain-containing protein n=1 Tax=Actinoallomurus sp. NPDC052274 TaxID=3155420 RepID=UPI00343E4BC7